MKARKKGMAAVLAAAALVAGALGAATYIDSGSGDPGSDDSAVVVPDGSHTAFSEGTALVTGTLSCPSAPVALEARFRTRDASRGIALRTDAVTGALIYF